MKVTGVSFIRNAVKYDYPIVEAIRSVLPVCDDFIVAVGNSEDNTYELIAQIEPEKVKILPTTWDDNLREGGAVLAQETNKALRAVPPETDWVFYIQGDEVIHEKYLPTIQQAMQTYLHDKKVDGLLFKYLHFYGSYDYVGSSYQWYRREIRIVRNLPEIYSYKDAQGFRKGNNQKLRVKLLDAYVYHYGWVKEPKAMQKKQETFHKYWHDDNWLEKHVPKREEFDYSEVDVLERFTGTHPQVMQARIARKNWQFDYDLSRNKLSLKDKFKKFVEKLTGGYIIGEYRNYILV
ncbi:MAG: glycosyltransferase family 2 protein [Raineya sp.]|nr:glycosyltransferase family 2 protein [Raineya sp.]